MRRAKHISRSIQNKCSARVLGSEEDGSETNSHAGGGRLETIQESEVVGERRNKRHSGSSGTSSPKGYKSMEVESSLLESVGKMSKYLGIFSRALEGDGGGITGEHMKRVVKKEVEES